MLTAKCVVCYKEILQAKMQAGTQTTLDLSFAQHSPVVDESVLRAGPSNFQHTHRM